MLKPTKFLATGDGLNNRRCLGYGLKLCLCHDYRFLVDAMFFGKKEFICSFY